VHNLGDGSVGSGGRSDGMDISKISPIVVTTYRPKQEVIDLRQERPGERVPIVVNGEVELVDPQTTCPTCFVTNTKRGPDGRCDLCGELWPPDEVKLAATEREEDEFLADSEEDEVAELRDDFNTALEHLEEWQHIAEALLANKKVVGKMGWRLEQLLRTTAQSSLDFYGQYFVI
jgi:hypothetical protein